MDKPSVTFKQATVQEVPSTDVVAQESDVMVVDTDWRDPFILYLKDETLPTNKVAQHRPEIKARAYLLVDGELYRRGGTNILMKCISTTDGQDLLEEIHSGICGNHASSKMLVAKPSGKDFTGQPQLTMRLMWCASVKAANFSRVSHMFLHTSYA